MAVERRRSGTLTAGGVLAIISGGLGILGALIWVAIAGFIAASGEADAVAVGTVYAVLGVIGVPVGIYLGKDFSEQQNEKRDKNDLNDKLHDF